MKRVVVAAPTFTATRPTAVPAMGQAVESGAISEDQLGQVEKFTYGMQIRNAIVQMPTVRQAEIYNTQLTPAQQDALTFAGYQVPAAPIPEDEEEKDGWAGNWFSDALHIADNAAGAVVGGGGAVVGAGMDVLAWGNNQAKAAYRQSTTYDWTQGGLSNAWFLTPAPLVGGLFDNWTHSNASENGATFFSPERLKQAEEQIADPTVYFYAKQVAEGKSVDTLFKELGGDPDKIAGLTVLTESQKFNDAVALINGAHVSPGRDAASMLGMSPDDRGYNVVSGSYDAAFTITADPTLLLGPGSAGLKAAKYGLSSADDVAKVFSKSSVQRHAQGFLDNFTTLTDDAASAAAKGDAYAMISSRYKAYEPMLDDMKRAGVSDVDSLRDYLSSADGFARLLQGKAAVKMPLMPYRTWAGEKARNIAAKVNPVSLTEKGAYRLRPDVTAFYGGTDEAVAETVDSIIKSRHSILGRAATFMARPVQKVPFGKRLYFDDDNAPDQIYKLARFVMSKKWASDTAAAFLNADVEGKRRIAKGLIETMGEVSGATTTAAGKKEWNRLLDDAFGESGAVHSYAPQVPVSSLTYDAGSVTARPALPGAKPKPDTYDVVQTPDGVEVLQPRQQTDFNVIREPDLMPDGSRVAVFAWQNRQYVEMPDFNEMYRLMVQLPMMEQARRGQGVYGIGRVITSGPLDKFTQQFWKPGVLLRPALPIRNGMEEATNFIMRHSLGAYVKGAVGTRYVSDYAKAKTIWSTLDDDAKAAANAGDKASVLTGWAKWRMKAEKAVLTDAEEAHLREFVELGGWRNIVDDMDEATDMRVLVTGGKSTGANAGKGHKVRPLSNTPYEQLPTAGDRGAIQFSTYATAVAKSPDGRIVLDNIHDRDEAIRQLVEWVETDGAWMGHTSKMVKELGPQQWAERVYDATRGTFSNRQGQIIDDLVSQAVDDGAVNPTWVIDNLADDMRPEFTSGRDFMLESEPKGFWPGIQRGINKGFDWSDSGVKQISRYPTFMPHYLRHRANMKVWQDELVAGGMKPSVAKKMAHNNAYEAAFRDVMEYSDNPAVRSQMAVIMRNIFPFWRAQEEFYVRWAKTGIFNPYGYRKLQLTYQGLSQVGVIYKGDDGQDVFNYPLVGEASQAVTKALSTIGVASYVPVPIKASSKVQYLNQGLDPNNILPSFGPGPSFLLGTIRSIYPNTANIERLLLGELGAGRNPVMNLLPTPVRRLLDSDEWKASSTLSAAAYLEYAGESPPADATPDEIQAYKDKLGKWAVGLSWMRAAFGAFAPASPTVEVANPETTKAWQKFAINNVSDQFWAILSQTGDYGATMAAWMKVHPDKLPFTVSKSDTPSGAIVGASKQVGEFVNSNNAFFKKYPSAAPFWLAGVGDGEFDPETWQLLGEMGVKEMKQFDDFYKDLKSSGQITTYYDARDAHEAWQEQQRAAGASSEILDAEQSKYDAWRQMFLAQNPLVNDYLSAGGVRQQERISTIQQMEMALADPAVPKTASSGVIQQLLVSYRAHEGWVAGQTGTDDASLAAKQAEQTQYEAYMTELAKSDPAAKMVWDRLLRYAG